MRLKIYTLKEFVFLFLLSCITSSYAMQPIQLSIFNMQTATNNELQALNQLIQNGIGIKDNENQRFTETFANMGDWFKKYCVNKEFLYRNFDERSLELVAEATFWAVNLGAGNFVKHMSYLDIKRIRPLAGTGMPEGLAKIMDMVSEKLQKPAWSHEASYAMMQATWAIYAVEHNKSERQFAKEDDDYKDK
jgi:hypothetical protein